VVGAVIGDEVTRIANVAQKAGLDTTIVTRYCLASQSLVNLDELFASIPKDQTKVGLRKFEIKMKIVVSDLLLTS
jgi:hypothetical protein